MNIALDWDGTVTRDPTLWMRFAQFAKVRGHDVRVVTMRYPSECESDSQMQALCRDFQLPIIATSRSAKLEAVLALDWPVHVWVDDNPRAVHMQAVDIWGWASPEGDVMDPAKG